MIRTPSLLLLATVVAVELPAQTSKAISSPTGVLTKEGSTSFFMSKDRRFQSVDQTVAGKLLVLKDFALRRDGNASSGASAHTVDVTLKIGSGNLGRLYGQLDRNFIGGPTTVFSGKSVKYPDWSSKPATPPAPFNFTLPFSKTFIYTGKSALVWDLLLTNGTSGNQVDRDFGNRSIRTGSTISNTGCSGFVQRMRLQNSGSGSKAFGMQGYISFTGAPASKDVYLAIGLQPLTTSPVQIPGWCGKIGMGNILSFAKLDKADASGTVLEQFLAAPYLKFVEGASIVTQGAAIAANGQTVLSNAMQGLMPSNSTTTSHPACYLYHSSTAKAATFAVYGGTYVARFGHL